MGLKKLKLIFIDHGYHQRTKSFEFFRKLLSREFSVKTLVDKSYLGYPQPSINEINRHKPDVVVYWSVIHPPSMVKQLNCRKIIWVPMFDSEVSRSVIGWLRYLGLGIKIICFSKKLYEKIHRLGFKAIYAQYFMKPSLNPARQSRLGNGLTAFFWNRTETINWSIVKPLLDKKIIKRVIFRNYPDPYNKSIIPSKKDVASFHIEMLNGWMKKQEYLKLVSSCDVFISPRLYEGIGLSFIEALSMGLCVVAPDKPTMNEYIRDHINGYVFDPSKPRQVDFKKFDSVLKASKITADEGYTLWEESKQKLLDFVIE